MKYLDKLPFYNEAVLPVHFVRAGCWGMRYGWPAKKLRVIGVTGTNGKTTTAFLIWKMLNEAGRKAGLMTTVAWGTTKLNEQMTHMTTEKSAILNKRIRKIAESGAEFLVLEVTSHAMAQFRTLGIPIEVAVMTNVTHEHLDYHKTFRKYRDAKRKLFRKAKFGVINADDPSAAFFKSDVEEFITYGVKKGEIKAREIELKNSGVEYEVAISGSSFLGARRAGPSSRAARANARQRPARYPRKDFLNATSDITIKTQIPGEFNVYNSLAALCVGKRLGLSDEEIVRGIFALESVEGRMVTIREGQKFEAMIDYAHTPDAFEKLLPSMKEATKGRLIVVFGSAGGHRDPSKREPMGRIAGKYADVVVLTEEDDRDTPGEKILEQIAVGARKSGKKDEVDLFKILDRPEAILFACRMAKKGDLVMFLGKGNEKTIERKDGAHKYYELTEVKKAIRKL